MPHLKRNAAGHLLKCANGHLRTNCCASTDPCDFDEILATFSGLTLCSCAEQFATALTNPSYYLANLVLNAMPVTLPRAESGCCFSANIGTVDVYSFDPFGGDPCGEAVLVGNYPVKLWAYCSPGTATANMLEVMGGPVSNMIIWSDGGLNGWIDWPNPNFGTFTRYIAECGSWYTKGGSLTLEAA